LIISVISIITIPSSVLLVIIRTTTTTIVHLRRGAAPIAFIWILISQDLITITISRLFRFYLSKTIGVEGLDVSSC
jgi:hypothetical protein